MIRGKRLSTLLTDQLDVKNLSEAQPGQYVLTRTSDERSLIASTEKPELLRPEVLRLMATRL
jgi:hypothetical protein